MAAPVYRYLAVSALTGKLIAELPLVGGRFTRLRSGAGAWDAEFPIGSPAVRVLDPIGSTTLNAVEIAVFRNRAHVYTGLLIDRDYDSDTRVLKISGREPWSYFDRHFIGSDLTYTGIDQGLIVQDLLTKAAADPGGDLRVDQPTTAQFTTGIVRTQSYLQVDCKPYSEAIDELAASSPNGFEFSLDGYFSNNVLRHRFSFGYPQVGTTSLQNRWSFPGQISRYRWAEAGGQQANEVFGVGDDGSGHIKLARIKTLDLIRPLLQAQATFRATSNATTLAAQTQQQANRMIYARLLAEVRVLGFVTPQIGDYNLGDKIPLKINDPFFQNVESYFRIAGWTITTPKAKQPEMVDLLVEVP